MQRHIHAADLPSVQSGSMGGIEIGQRIGIDGRVEINHAMPAADIGPFAETNRTIRVPPDTIFRIGFQLQMFFTIKVMYGMMDQKVLGCFIIVLLQLGVVLA